jgi:hypothetical protein
MHVALGIGGLAGGVALVGVGLYIANDYVKEQASKADVIFRIQRMQNVAKAIKQFGSQIVGEPNAVLDSNVFITAIDTRTDSNGTKFENKWAYWRWWCSDTRNDGAWCAFDTITDLSCAPKAKDYRTLDGRSLSTFITIFSRLLNAEVVDYARLREYLEHPVRFERTLGAVAPSVPVVSEVEDESNSD